MKRIMKRTCIILSNSAGSFWGLVGETSGDAGVDGELGNGLTLIVRRSGILAIAAGRWVGLGLGTLLRGGAETVGAAGN